ncbi:filamentous hemagglutinin family outer membrane protein [Tolypothrix tenuis PCC 7101]|uniref:Filamentous hemagglutinin family outer membrane protein n=1 Tax=Tolypothrix tenuis PCC 7101 TaxID=231146 RepID=A0A1Z4N1I9_9CYAN|nr:S-layer family protein [Aulosira sp. FACHB-113]BAY99576.1 filamentous hemagglutinin family outer membrane protein [Tolypothrix tenuis PCC 7101]BAZ76502.1 filamentous hemagglutinin family outer membrane protein [Aulosira laxa NIES-50]
MKLTLVGFVVYGTICICAVDNNSVHAQVTPDNTLGTDVTGSSNYSITNGTRVGNNLFHSFREFALPTGSSASFENATDIQNIFSRVTGGQVSNIDGLISAKGSANLFLLNPSGIIFGPNASLNIGGSFVATTANSIKFADGSEFSAVDPATKPLLTMNVPIGLQMGQNSQGITVENLGHRIKSGIFTPLDRTQNPTGLQVKAGNTLALIGNGVNFSGGIVATDGGGHLEVGSISDGQVGINANVTGWVGDYSTVRQFQDIHLAQQSLLDASGNSGSIQLQGRNINLTDGSAILIQNFGALASEGIKIRAMESLNLIGNLTDGSIGSAIQTDNLGTAQAGDITISAGQLSIQNGGLISTRMFTAASGGNITANVAGLIDIGGFAPSNPIRLSSITTTTVNSANAGNVTVSTDNLRLLNGAGLSSTTIGFGQAGTVRVNAADLIEIAGNNSIILSASALTSTTLGPGNANNTFVNTSRLVVRDGGFLGSSTVATGSSGSVIINASEFVDIQGRGAGSITPSRIVSTAETLDPITQAFFGLPPIPTGNAGSLIINTPSLTITDGAYITVRNDGPGISGDLQINANSIFLDTQGNITASTASGNGGNIKLNLQNYLLMRQHSLMSGTAGGNGNGGNININSPIIFGLENSDITANAVQGKGGNINISTQGIIGLEYSSQLTPENDITASSEFGVNGIVQVNTVGVDPNSGLVELPVNFTDSSQQIASGCNANAGSSFVATGRGGRPQNPNQEVRSDRTWSDIRDISAFHTTKPVQAQISTSPQPLVQATSWHRNAQGKIELVADKSSLGVQPALTCAAVADN